MKCLRAARIDELADSNEPAIINLTKVFPHKVCPLSRLLPLNFVLPRVEPPETQQSTIRYETESKINLLVLIISLRHFDIKRLAVVKSEKLYLAADLSLRKLGVNASKELYKHCSFSFNPKGVSFCTKRKVCV